MRRYLIRFGRVAGTAALLVAMSAVFVVQAESGSFTPVPQRPNPEFWTALASRWVQETAILPDPVKGFEKPMHTARWREPAVRDSIIRTIGTGRYNALDTGLRIPGDTRGGMNLGYGWKWEDDWAIEMPSYFIQGTVAFGACGQYSDCKTDDVVAIFISMSDGSVKACWNNQWITTAGVMRELERGFCGRWSVEDMWKLYMVQDALDRGITPPFTLTSDDDNQVQP